MFFDKLAEIKHLETDDTDADKEAYQPDENQQQVQINIQPAPAEVVALSDSALGRVFVGYVGISVDARRGDMLITGTGDDQCTYKIKAIKKYDYGPGQHQELILVEGED